MKEKIKKICSVDGCDKGIRAKGLCTKHYTRLIRHGDIEKVLYVKNTICIVDGCNTKASCKGYCSKHYQRIRNMGTTESPFNIEMCAFPGCTRPHKSKGYCTMHYARYLRHGDPSITHKEIHHMMGTPEYRSWMAMNQRCNYPGIINYHRYGGRGIKVCDRWKSFVLFLEDMGKKPFPKAQIDRIDNDGNYEPNNCRWVTQKENARNKSTVKLTIKKATEIKRLYTDANMKAVDIAKEYSVSDSTIADIVKGRTWKDA